MMYADVSRAYFYAPASRAVYVKLPDEDREEGDEHMCGKLNVSMYGTRDAAKGWQETLSAHLISLGFVFTNVDNARSSAFITICK